jgi:hypothetical protein
MNHEIAATTSTRINSEASRNRNRRRFMVGTSRLDF